MVKVAIMLIIPDEPDHITNLKNKSYFESLEALKREVIRFNTKKKNLIKNFMRPSQGR